MCAYFGRGLNKVQHPYVLEDIYKFYVTTIEKEGPFDIGYKLYRSIIEDYIRFVTEMLFEGKEYNIPVSLGRVQIVKLKMNYSNTTSLPVDWVNTVKYNKRIVNLNEHSRGFKYRFRWFKSRLHLTVNNNYILYRLVFTRANKRRLAKIIKSGEQDYLQIN